MAYLSAISPENNSIWRYCSSLSFPAHETPKTSSDHLRFSVNRILGLQSDDRATKKTEESNNTVSGQCQYCCCCCCCCCFFFRLESWFAAIVDTTLALAIVTTCRIFPLRPLFIYIYIYLSILPC